MDKTERPAFETATEMLEVEQLVACVPVRGGVFTFGGKIETRPTNDSEAAAYALAACVRARRSAERAGLHPVD